MNLQGVWMGSTRIQSQRRVTSCDLSTRKEKGQNSPLGIDPTLSSCLNEFAVAPECTFLTMLHDEDFFVRLTANRVCAQLAAMKHEREMPNIKAKLILRVKHVRRSSGANEQATRWTVGALFWAEQAASIKIQPQQQKTVVPWVRCEISEPICQGCPWCELF